MTIGFASGVFYRLQPNPLERFSRESLSHCAISGANAIELHCRDEAMINFLIDTNDIELSAFDFISLHAPDFAYGENNRSHIFLSKLEKVSKKYELGNVVFHTDMVLDWNVFDHYEDIPISIENMDERKKFGRTVYDTKSILDKHDFGLTLDLQHCFVNDASMKLASDFHNEFKDRIVEYHISGFDEKVLHYPLFKTRQDTILKSLKFKNLPIIIESSFDDFKEQEKELDYIQKHLC